MPGQVRPETEDGLHLAVGRDLPGPGAEAGKSLRQEGLRPPLIQ